MAIGYNWIFVPWSAVKGHLVASEGSYQKLAKEDVKFKKITWRTEWVSEWQSKLYRSFASKNNVLFVILDPKKQCFNIHDSKRVDLNFDLWSEVRGHLVASERSYCKKKIRGQRSFGGLIEGISKNCHFWTP